VHLSFVFLGFVIACFEQVLQVSTLLLSSCDDLLVVDEGCVVDCHVLRCVWLATAYARGYMSPSTLSFIYWPWASVMEQIILEDKCCHGHRCSLVVVAFWLSSPRPD
jgi:hypothetical protein